MKNSTRAFRGSLAPLAAGFVVCLASSPVVAGSEHEGISVQAEIDALRAEIRQLTQAQGLEQTDAERRAEIRAIVQDVLADAEDRISFQDDAVIAGWKKGFRLQSPDGNFLLKVGGQIQVRYVLNHAERTRETPYASPNGPGDSAEINPDTNTPYQRGFENRRTKLQFEGHVVDPSWTYRIKGAFARATGAFILEEAWVAHACGDGWKIKVGQFKAPWMREELVSSSKQLAVERSIVNEYFNQGYSQGLEVSWAGDDIKVAAWTGDGLGARGFGPTRFNGQNTAWNDTATSYAFASRGEWKLAGEWSQFKSFSSRRGSDFGAMVGLAGAVQRGNAQVGTAGDGAVAGGVTADATLAFDGASIFVSGVWTNVLGGNGTTNNPFGFTVQGGYFVSEDIEAFARYAYMDYDLEQVDDRSGSYNGLTVGANWFLNAAVKLTCDWSINMDSLGTGAFVASSAGFRRDVNGARDQWALRAQLQLLF